MLRRLSPTAREIIDLAERIARKQDQDYIGTEHALLAILEHGNNAAARTLTACGVDLEKVQQKIAELARQSMDETWVLGRLPGSPHFRNVVAKALNLAEQEGSSSVEPEHLLMALASEPGSVAYEVLVQLGADYKKLTQRLGG